MVHSARFRFASVIALACSLPGAVFASSVSFSKVVLPEGFSGQHADLNNDGREDFVYPNAGTGAFEVVLSTGDGSYASPASYTIPGGADTTDLAVGDFNSDGKADLLVFGSDIALHLFLNNGSGKFSQKAVFAIPGGGAHPAVGDFNHDGVMDVAFQTGKNGVPLLTVWFGNGKSGFTAGPTSSFAPGGGGDYVLLGDFDGDGKADLAFGAFEDPDIQVLYGDGTGRFPKISVIETDDVNVIFTAADVNGDGRMDVIGTQPSAGVDHVSVFYGKANRTWSLTTIPTPHAAFETAVADVNGDGINDLIVVEQFCTSPSSYCVGVLTRNSNGSYNPQQTIDTSPEQLGFISVLRANRDTKPDLMVGNILMLNTTSGSFPTCAAPNAFEGINVCSPAAGIAVASPISFKIGVAGQVVMRDVEVWVDGKKLAEQLDGFSNYTFLNHNLSLAKGSHAVTIYAVGWDQSLQKKSFTVNVK